MSAEFNYQSGEPLSLGESAVLSQITMDFLDESSRDRSWYPLTASNPGDGFLLRTIDGEMQFSIQRLEHQKQIESRQSVVAVTYDTNDLMRHSEFKLYGASEGTTMLPDNLGVIEQYADLSYAPLRREPLWKQDFELGDEEYDKKVRSGEIVRTQKGHMRMVMGSVAVLPIVLDLARIEADGSVDYIFKHED